METECRATVEVAVALDPEFPKPVAAGARGRNLELTEVRTGNWVTEEGTGTPVKVKGKVTVATIDSRNC